MKRRTAVATLAGLAWAGRCHAHPLPDTLADGIDGLIACVDRRGHPPHTSATGWKDKANRTPADPLALFKIASLSKLYIAAAAAKLVAAGRLPLDGTLATLLPAVANELPNADRITLKQLLQHRSGLFNFTDSPQFPWFDPPRDLAGHLALLRGRPALFEPGARHRYSNTNYLLVGALLDRALGHSHHRYIDEALLAPLGLTQTFHRTADVEPGRLASARHPAHAGDLKTLDWAAPGGSMAATAQDVGAFLRALIDGRLLTAQERAVYASVYAFEHTGLLPGYFSIARHHRELDAVVVLFANTSGEARWGQVEAAYGRVVRGLRREQA